MSTLFQLLSHFDKFNEDTILWSVRDMLDLVDSEEDVLRDTILLLSRTRSLEISSLALKHLMSIIEKRSVEVIIGANALNALMEFVSRNKEKICEMNNSLELLECIVCNARTLNFAQLESVFDVVNNMLANTSEDDIIEKIFRILNYSRAHGISS
jgi:intracellular sulfur oxidation DsrE/DsrF family protein